MLKIIKVLIISSLVFFVTAGSLAFSFKNWRTSILQGVKIEAEKNFSEIFQRKVTIREASGIIIGKIVLKDIYIPNLGQASEIILNFNPLKYLYFRGDIVRALTKITVLRGNFNVTRDRENHWNISSFWSQEGKNSSTPPPFRCRIIFKNCQILYLDQIGFRAPTKSFATTITSINGTVELQKENFLKFALFAKTPETRIKGWYDFKNNRYEINLTADKLNLSKWGNYALPIPDLILTSGSTDLLLQITPPKTKGWPVALVGKALLHDVAGKFQNYEIRKTSGEIFMADENLTFSNLKTTVNQVPLVISGRLYNFSQLNLDLKIIASKAELFQQKFSGEAHLTKKGNLIKADTKFSDLWKGTARGKITLDLSQKPAYLTLTANFSKINLTALAQNSPGVEGQATGNFELSGPIENLQGKTEARLTQALVFGQPLEKASAIFKIKSNELILESLTASSGNIYFSSSGKIKRDFSFDLHTEVFGFRLAGMGILGKMQATIDRFRGRLAGTLNQELLTSPLKNIYAEGEAKISSGQLGEQLFDSAQGKISIGKGKIKIEDAYVQNKLSILKISGQTGLGIQTSLKLSGQNLDLEDLKILNYLLPQEAKDPTGKASLEVEVSGVLSSETKLTSLDPLFDLNAQGNFSLSNGSIAGIPLTLVNLNLTWQEHNLSFYSSKISLPESDIDFNLSFKKDGSLSGSLEGKVSLAHFQNILKRYGKIEGKLGTAMIFSGKIDRPSLQSSFWVNNFRFNEIYFDKISGSLQYENETLTILQPLKLIQGTDVYHLSGKLQIAPEVNSNLRLDIVGAELSSFYKLALQIYGEVQRQMATLTERETLKLNLSHLLLPRENTFLKNYHLQLYSANGEKNYFLKPWAQSVAELEKSLATAPEEKFGGALTGSLEVKGMANNLSGNFIISVINGYYGNFYFDKLQATGNLNSQEVTIANATLSKGGGVLTARGNYAYADRISFYLTANNLPLDVLQLVFPEEEFKGRFSMNTDLSGSLQNPDISLAATAREIIIAGTNFNQATVSLSKKGNRIFVHEFSLLQQNHLSQVYGSIPLNPKDKIDLEINLKDNAVGLLNLFTKEIKWRDGKAMVSAKIVGQLENLSANGKIQVSQGKVYVKALESELQNLEGKAQLIKNLLNINYLTATWSGKTTRDYLNQLGLAGTIDISKVFSKENLVTLNLAFSPTAIYAAFPNLFSGEIKIEELNLQGPFSFDMRQGPLLAGKVELNNSLITLSQGSPTPKPPLNLNLDLKLSKNNYAVMGNVMTLDLSNIFMNLEVSSDLLKVAGNLNAPSLLGKVLLKRGTINIFNREFTLLSPEMQKRFFPYDAEKIQDNIANFKTGEGMLPEINLTASVNIEEKEKDESGKYQTKQITVLAKLKGAMGDKEGIKIFLQGFTEDKTKSPPEMIPTAYSEQELKVMLLPDFIKALAGISRPEKEEELSAVDPNLVLADYLNSRVQTLLFRTVAREAEKALGLESLTLEYNFGPKIREALGVKETKSLEGEKPAWSVGFIKGITDRLYIDVRYAQTLQQMPGAPGQTTFNYQLTYKITPIWSIIYYREPISLAELTTGYQKITLKAGLSLW